MRKKNEKKSFLFDVNDKKMRVRPYKEALYASLLYLIFGVTWIFVSDNILNILVKKPEAIQKIQLAKGWIFVILTGLIIYLIILYRMKLLESAKDEIYELSHYDPMTGLLNWQGLTIAFKHMLAENKDGLMALCYIDIDNIKHINETLGHDNGNLLLKKIAMKLKNNYENKGVISRVSGDEFVLLLPLKAAEEVESMALGIVQVAKTIWHEKDYEFLVTVSLGIALYPKHGQDFDGLMRHADLATFIAKEKGKNQHSIYKDALGLEKKNYVEVISQIRKGIENKEFVLYYQPIINLSTKTMIGVEALIRWEHPYRGFLTPFHFIDIAEDSGQINALGEWVFQEACHQLKLWQDQSYDLKMSINLSGKRLFDKDLIDKIKKVLKTYALDPRNIQIEITETSVMDNIEKAIHLLNEMRDLGLVIALDDFGTGYSSLTYLQMFPIEVLKIDKDFISNISMEGVEKDNNIIDAIINLAHSLNLKIVAEGIESYEQAEYLLNSQCDYGQGYYYDRPMTAQAIEKKYFNQETRI